MAPVQVPAPDDAELVEQARAGDREALNLLLSRHLDAVYDTTYRILGDRDAAQDAAQDAFVSAVRALDSFRGDASFRTWLLRIAMNAARSSGRRAGRRRETSLDVVGERPGSAPDPEERATVAEEVARAEAALAELPEKQRLAVTLRLQGLSHREIADATDSTEGSARVNYHLGIKRLRERMQ
jgi:RNA polymerase sigma-70 factor (ECF subfamily)